MVLSIVPGDLKAVGVPREGLKSFCRHKTEQTQHQLGDVTFSRIELSGTMEAYIYRSIRIFSPINCNARRFLLP